MLICTPAVRNRAVNASLVNCAPWSVLKISGRGRQRPLERVPALSVENRQFSTS